MLHSLAGSPEPSGFFHLAPAVFDPRSAQCRTLSKRCQCRRELGKTNALRIFGRDRRWCRPLIPARSFRRAVCISGNSWPVEEVLLVNCNGCRRRPPELSHTVRPPLRHPLPRVVATDVLHSCTCWCAPSSAGRRKAGRSSVRPRDPQGTGSHKDSVMSRREGGTLCSYRTESLSRKQLPVLLKPPPSRTRPPAPQQRQLSTEVTGRAGRPPSANRERRQES